MLHFVHGYFSLGTAFGALAGMGMSGLAFPVQWQLLITAGTSVPFLVYFIRDLPNGLGRADRASAETGGLEHVDAMPVWKDQRLLMIGLIMLVLALTEGAANDWLPIIMVDEYGVGAVSSSLIYFGFTAAMTVGRFSGGYFLKRFGRGAVVRGSALMGFVGLAMVIFGHHLVVAGLAATLWGMGASLGFPVALSSAGDSGPNSPLRVKIVAVAGYISFLVGPPFFGFLGQNYGLRHAMFALLFLLGVAAIIAPAARERARNDAEDPVEGARGLA